MVEEVKKIERLIFLIMFRGLMFIQGFFYEVSNGEQSIDIAAGKSIYFTLAGLSVFV